MKKLAGHPEISIQEYYRELAEYADLNKIDIDLYGQGKFLNAFENEVAELTGMEAAVFLPSGVMAQLIAMKVWGDEAGIDQFACHESSHLIRHEEESYKHLVNMRAHFIGNKNEVPLVEDLVNKTSNCSSLIYELPMRHLGGDMPSWDQWCEIKDYCKSEKLKLHVDGARIFETQHFYQRNIKEIVSGTDSLFISFYKGFGSTSGSMLLGSKDFIAKARIWSRRFGGNLFQLFPLAVPAKMNFDKRKNSFEAWVIRAGEISHILSKELKLDVQPETAKTNMIHVLIPKKAVDLREISKNRKDIKLGLGIWGEESPGVSRVEFTVGEATMKLSLLEIKEIFQEICN